MSNLVQPILVYPCQPRNKLIADAAIASVMALQQLEGDWESWLKSSFTKTVRRVKKVDKLNLISRELGLVQRNQVSAFKPLAYDDFPSVLRNAQVSHWEQYVLPNEQLISSTDYQIILNSDFPLSTGKACAQAAHVLMKHCLAHPEVDVDSLTLNVWERALDSADEATALSSIRDNGLTEVSPNTLTAVLVL